jgi:hypothetical protein
MLLAGDRNIAGSTAAQIYPAAMPNDGFGNSPSSGAGQTVTLGSSFAAGATAPAWTERMHIKSGNVLLSDGSAHTVNDVRLRDMLRQSGDTSTTPGPNTLFFP